MYRLTMDYFGVFDHLHSAFEHVNLSCFNVWWEGDLPWDPEPLFGKVSGEYREESGEWKEGDWGRCWNSQKLQLDF